MQKNLDAKTQYSELDQKLQKQEEVETSESLLQNVSMQLYRLMNEVVEKEVTPQTVNAACACATEIHRMLKLNLEIMRLE